MLTDALNATTITYNGNESMIQNDMGNTLIQDKTTGSVIELSEGFVPVGMIERGGILYIASMNKQGNCELGSVPSPMITYDYKEEPDSTEDLNIVVGEDIEGLETIKKKTEFEIENTTKSILLNQDYFQQIKDVQVSDVVYKVGDFICPIFNISTPLIIKTYDDRFAPLISSYDDWGKCKYNGVYNLTLNAQISNGQVVKVPLEAKCEYADPQVNHWLEQQQLPPFIQKYWFYIVNGDPENYEFLLNNNLKYIPYPNVPRGKLSIHTEINLPKIYEVEISPKDPQVVSGAFYKYQIKGVNYDIDYGALKISGIKFNSIKSEVDGTVLGIFDDREQEYSLEDPLPVQKLASDNLSELWLKIPKNKRDHTWKFETELFTTVKWLGGDSVTFSLGSYNFKWNALYELPENPEFVFSPFEQQQYDPVNPEFTFADDLDDNWVNKDLPDIYTHWGIINGKEKDNGTLDYALVGGWVYDDIDDHTTSNNWNDYWTKDPQTGMDNYWMWTGDAGAVADIMGEIRKSNPMSTFVEKYNALPPKTYTDLSILLSPDRSLQTYWKYQSEKYDIPDTAWATLTDILPSADQTNTIWAYLIYNGIPEYVYPNPDSYDQFKTRHRWSGNGKDGVISSVQVFWKQAKKVKYLYRTSNLIISNPYKGILLFTQKTSDEYRLKLSNVLSLVDVHTNYYAINDRRVYPEGPLDPSIETQDQTAKAKELVPDNCIAKRKNKDHEIVEVNIAIRTYDLTSDLFVDDRDPAEQPNSLTYTFPDKMILEMQGNPPNAYYANLDLQYTYEGDIYSPYSLPEQLTCVDQSTGELQYFNSRSIVSPKGVDFSKGWEWVAQETNIEQTGTCPIEGYEKGGKDIILQPIGGEPGTLVVININAVNLPKMIKSKSTPLCQLTFSYQSEDSSEWQQLSTQSWYGTPILTSQIGIPQLTNKTKIKCSGFPESAYIRNIGIYAAETGVNIKFPSAMCLMESEYQIFSTLSNDTSNQLNERPGDQQQAGLPEGIIPAGSQAQSPTQENSGTQSSNTTQSSGGVNLQNHAVKCGFKEYYFAYLPDSPQLACIGWYSLNQNREICFLNNHLGAFQYLEHVQPSFQTLLDSGLITKIY